MGCVSIILKIFLFSVNFCVSILGLVIVAGGVVLAHFRHQTNSEIALLIAVALIVLGSVLFFIALSGCCGAVGGIPCFLIFYAIFNILLTTANVYLIVILFQNNSLAEDTISNIFENLFRNADMRNTFYVIEYLFSCCGTTGVDSYELLDLSIPPTCCRNYNWPSLDDVGDIEDIINQNGTIVLCTREETFDGCSPILINFFTTILGVFAYICIAVLVIQVLAVLSSFYLVKRIRRYRGKVY